jgi:hypothetical protein
VTEKIKRKKKYEIKRRKERHKVRDFIGLSEEWNM